MSLTIKTFALATFSTIVLASAAVRYYKSIGTLKETYAQSSLPRTNLGNSNTLTNKESNEEEWTVLECKKWYRKVVGSQDEILQALKQLGRPPTNYNELQFIISDIRAQDVNKTNEESICYY